MESMTDPVVRAAADAPVAAALTAVSVDATLEQRGARYGDFTDHAGLCDGLIASMENFSKPAPNEADPTNVTFPWYSSLSPVQRQALRVIMDKIARILNGDANYDDNWHDIQGYAKLAEDRLPKAAT